MNWQGPSPDYLAALNATLNAQPAPPPAPAPAPPPALLPTPAPPGQPSISWLGKGAPALGVPQAPAAADPFGLMSGTAPAQAPPSEVTPVDPKLMPQPTLTPDAIKQPAPPPPQPMPSDVQFAPVGGGVMPAHEAPVRGPTQNAHLMASFEDPMAAADSMQGRSEAQAANEVGVYEEQAARALRREEGAQRAMLKRQAEMDQLQADYEDSVQQLGQMQGAQNAFAAAMDKFHSEDAATGIARAAAIDYGLARIGQLQGQWKGVEAANAADDLRAKLLSERERTIAAGIQFVPARAAGGGYQMIVRGQRIPGLVSEKEAQRIALEHGVKPAEATDLEMTKGGIALTGKAMEQAAKGHENAVRMPTGEVINAPNDKVAGELRALATSQAEIDRLVDRALKIRSDAAFRASPEARAELDSIQSRLVTQYGVQNHLGALSNSDLGLAVSGTADVFKWGPGAEKQLNVLREGTHAKTRDYVSTIPGAPPKASGTMPGSAVYPGKKK